MDPDGSTCISPQLPSKVSSLGFEFIQDHFQLAMELTLG